METRQKIAPTLRQMEIGEVVYFPIDRFNSVTTTCSVIGMMIRRKFRTRTDRKKEMVAVMRVQ